MPRLRPIRAGDADTSGDTAFDDGARGRALFSQEIAIRERPDLAIRTGGGGIWQNDAGLGWANPYNKGVWDYVVSIGEAAA